MHAKMCARSDSTTICLDSWSTYMYACMHVCMYVGGVHGLVCECSDGAVERRLLRVPHPGDHRAAAGELQAGPPARYGPMGIAAHERTGAAGLF